MPMSVVVYNNCWHNILRMLDVVKIPYGYNPLPKYKYLRFKPTDGGGHEYAGYSETDLYYWYKGHQIYDATKQFDLIMAILKATS